MVRELKTLRAPRAAEVVVLERNRFWARQPAPEVSFAGLVGVRGAIIIHNYWYTVGSGSPFRGNVLRRLGYGSSTTWSSAVFGMRHFVIDALTDGSKPSCRAGGAC